MLKACWDCIAGFNNDNRGPVGNGGAYGVQLTEDTQRAPPWPDPQFADETMLVLPKKLNSGDRIDVFGRMTNDPQRFTVNLITGYNSPDYQNIACQLEVRFPSSNENKVALRIIQNGSHEEIDGDFQSIPATDWFTDTSFKFEFSVSVSNGQHGLDISIGESFLEHLNLKHRIEDIRYLSLQGDIAKVDKLEVKFA